MQKRQDAQHGDCTYGCGLSQSRMLTLNPSKANSLISVSMADGLLAHKEVKKRYRGTKIRWGQAK